MTVLSIAEAREQEALRSEPYDRWISPDGNCLAQFHREKDRFVLRFPGDADFLIDAIEDTAQAHPVPGTDEATIRKLFDNSILPLLGNYAGGLFLHGSAVRIGSAAIAFLGVSRSGKTTLAAAFAKAGHPFLTEDVIDLSEQDGRYWLCPKQSALRLFKDSAESIRGVPIADGDAEEKFDVASDADIPFAGDPAPLRHVFILGENTEAHLLIRSLGKLEALTALLPHSFVLDVEDRRRLRSHFDRLGNLSQNVECHALDYPRDYSELPTVIEQIQTRVEELEASNEAN